MQEVPDDAPVSLSMPTAPLPLLPPPALGRRCGGFWESRTVGGFASDWLEVKDRMLQQVMQRGLEYKGCGLGSTWKGDGEKDQLHRTTPHCSGYTNKLVKLNSLLVMRTTENQEDQGVWFWFCVCVYVGRIMYVSLCVCA